MHASVKTKIVLWPIFSAWRARRRYLTISIARRNDTESRREGSILGHREFIERILSGFESLIGASECRATDDVNFIAAASGSFLIERDLRANLSAVRRIASDSRDAG